MRIKIKIEEITEVSYAAREYQKVADKGNESDGGAIYAYVDAGEAKKKELTTMCS